MQADRASRGSEHIRRPGHVPTMASSASHDIRIRSEDSWIELASQPSSSSLSSIDEENTTTGLRQEGDARARRRRTLRELAPPGLSSAQRASSKGGASSQEEYEEEESESESDRVMTSSGEGLGIPAVNWHGGVDDDDENRTAINHPLRNDECFTPQPNAFSHPPSAPLRAVNHQVSGSYFPSPRRDPRPPLRATASAQEPNRPSHLPQNILSPSYDATAAHHEEVLRTSLSTLLSCAAAARNLTKLDPKRQTITQQPPPRRIEPISFRLLPDPSPQLQEPTFQPTLGRPPSLSTSTSSSPQKDHKRKAVVRSTSRERRALKKARRAEDFAVSPTLLTWVVSAGVVVVLSALSFGAGYSVGKEAGRMEAGGGLAGSGGARSCARAGREGLGLRRSLAAGAVQV